MTKFFYLVLLSVLIISCNSNLTENEDNTEEYKSATLLNVGQNVPSFNISSLKGKNINIDSLKGKTIFLNFFTLSCPMCMKELPKIEKEMWQKYKNRKDIVILSIGREHFDNELIDLYLKKQFSFPMAADTNRYIYSLFAEKFVPRNIIIDKTGKIIFTKVGYNEKDGLTEIIDILKNELDYKN
ncbi:MAG: TlpA family protein disulfide reductase [Bacteroidales bacterium]|nr:TlpA family protein disulfide reductase [Bacteroidales bacterium]MBN2756570.1 TlpA family protein disulfide reductase [Bacteroidales bacterium]